jgi:hypothetical protein
MKYLAILHVIKRFFLTTSTVKDHISGLGPGISIIQVPFQSQLIKLSRNVANSNLAL